MSEQGPADPAHAPSEHAASEHASSEHGHADHHDSEPAGLDPDEPNTPFWLTGLGGALFLLAAVFFLATAGEDPEDSAADPGPNGSPAAELEAADEPPSEE